MRALAIELVVALAAVVAVSASLYILVSFTVLRRHADPRSLAHVARAIFREALAIAVTQPLIPLFYFIGLRMGGPRTGRPIILVHGYFQNRVDFLYLARALRHANLGPIYGFNYDWLRSIDLTAAKLGRFVEWVCKETGAPKVAIVAHSLGGIVALEYLASPEGGARVERCITIASPHAGVLWRGVTVGASARQLQSTSAYMKTSVARTLSIPTLSIYSSHDNIVHPASTSQLALRGGEDQLVAGLGHLGILFSREVADATVRALSTPTPARLPSPAE